MVTWFLNASWKYKTILQEASNVDLQGYFTDFCESEMKVQNKAEQVSEYETCSK